jgi:hypothetical protein
MRVATRGFLVHEQVDRFRFRKESEKVLNCGGEPADGTPAPTSRFGSPTEA